jgi:hypothetical protein
MSDDGGLASILYLLGLALYLYVGANVIRKAGYSPWWVLVMFVPLVGIVAAVKFARADWPVHRDLRALLRQVEQR